MIHRGSVLFSGSFTSVNPAWVRGDRWIVLCCQAAGFAASSLKLRCGLHLADRQSCLLEKTYLYISTPSSAERFTNMGSKGLMS